MKTKCCNTLKNFKGEKPYECYRTEHEYIEHIDGTYANATIRYYKCGCGRKFKTTEGFFGLKNYLQEQISLFIDTEIEKNKNRIARTVCDCPRCKGKNRSQFRTLHGRNPVKTIEKKTFIEYDIREKICRECGTSFTTKEEFLGFVNDNQLSCLAA